MNSHVILRAGTLVEVEVRPTKEDDELDRLVLDRLKALAMVGAEMHCRLYLKELNLVIQLDEPKLPDGE